MIPPLSLFATSSQGLARAGAATAGTLPDKETLRAEQKAVDDRKLKTMAEQERFRARAPERAARHAARLENMQKALQRLMSGGFQGPAMVAVQTPSAAFAAYGGSVAEVSTGATDDAVSVSAAVVQVSTGDGADAVAIRADRVTGVSTDDDGGNSGRTRFFDNADAVAIAARHVEGVHTGGGSDAVAITSGRVAGIDAGDGADRVAVTAVIAGGITGGGGDDDLALVAETGMASEPAPETEVGRAMVAAWADGSAEGRMARAWYAAGMDGGDGNDRIAVTVADAMGVRGGAGNDSITAAGGSFALHFAAGDGQDMVRLTDGAEAVVMLDRSLSDEWTVERGEDRLTLRFGAGLSITFEGLAGAGAIGVGRLEKGQDIALIHRPPGLDRTL